jgi:hypothetical protein
MAFDQTKVGQLTAALMDRLDNDFGEDCELGDLLLIAEVLGPHGSTITMQFSEPRRHVNVGLLTVAQNALLHEES